MRQIFTTSLLLLVLSVLLVCCNASEGNKVTPEEMDTQIAKKMQSDFTSENVKDSTSSAGALKFIYAKMDYQPLWSKAERSLPVLDTFLYYIENCKLDGLFPEDYRFDTLTAYKAELDKDSLKRLNPDYWVRNDRAFTDAFLHVLQDLNQGRFVPDSVLLLNNRKTFEPFFFEQIEALRNDKSILQVFNDVQPTHESYVSLKSGIKVFLDSMDNKKYSYVTFPYKDSLKFIKQLKARLSESGVVWPQGSRVDSTTLDQAVRKYQSKKGLIVDGKPGAAMVRTLNNNDAENFKRIAITLDKYKQLPAIMPAKYIWVNLPAYNLKVVDNGAVALESKIICGKPNTSTPLITSAITDIIIYPTWTVPTSIIKKEMIPGLKRNPGYLARKGLYLLNSKGENVNPYSVNWSKYKSGIPYAVQQGSGDNNALGIIKFNFANAYSVYLHDTNQRYLYTNKVRSLSHGCVRVQEWKKLAFYFADNDSLMNTTKEKISYNKDSIENWLAKKKMRKINVNNKIPLYIQYFGCEFVNGGIIFYDDMYDVDKNIRNMYMARR